MIRFISRIETAVNRIPLFGLFFLWFAIILYLYWPSIIILPKRDHSIMLMGRHLAENDWKWFIDMLFYSRTRVLQPGDYVVYRPVHMAILALGDIFARTNFVFQGVLGCMFMAGTATAFCALTRQFIGTITASTITLLWISQLAGVEIIMWQHINPYLLVPTFLFVALLLISGENWNQKKAWITATAILAACFTHELCVMISLALGTMFFFDRRSQYGSRITSTFLPAGITALALNIIDYKFIHPPPSILSTEDVVTVKFSLASIYNELIPLAGSIGSAFFRPDSVTINLTDEFSFLWIFTDIAPKNLHINAIVIYATVISIFCLLLWQVRKHGITRNNLLGIFFIVFFGAIFGITAFRVLTRTIGYMFGAGYYYSLFSLALCGAIAYSLSLAGKRVLISASIVSFFLAVWHIQVLHAMLSTTTSEKKLYAHQISEIRNQLKQNPAICFGGMDSLTLSPNLRNWMPLFQEFSCANSPTARPLYVGGSQNGLELKERLFMLQPTENDMLPATLYNQTNINISRAGIVSPTIPFGHSIDMIVQTNTPFKIIISPEFQLPYVFNMHYNEFLTNVTAYNNTLAWNSAAAENFIQIQFTRDNLFFFANKILVSVLPRGITATGNKSTIKIVPEHKDKSLQLKRFTIASKPTELIMIR